MKYIRFPELTGSDQFHPYEGIDFSDAAHEVAHRLRFVQPHITVAQLWSGSIRDGLPIMQVTLERTLYKYNVWDSILSKQYQKTIPIAPDEAHKYFQPYQEYKYEE